LSFFVRCSPVPFALWFFDIDKNFLLQYRESFPNFIWRLAS